MRAVTRLEVVPPAACPPQNEAGAWAAATDEQRDRAARRARLIQPLLSEMRRGATASAAVKHFLARVKAGRADPPAAELAASLGRGGKPVSRATLLAWIKAYQEHGREGLLDRYKGRARTVRGWEARVHYYLDRPSKPNVGEIVWWLRNEDGFTDVKEWQVRRYVNALPATLGKDSPVRLGRHYYNQNIKPHRELDTSVLPVGYLYETDGHTCDVYVAHPSTGNPYRPELTVWLDKRSQYCVAWTLGDTENTLNTLNGLVLALAAHDHVPAQVHMDPGPGFKARQISDEVTGFCSRLGIEPVFALPGNARGKGLVEGWFEHFERRVGKRFTTYCGHDRTDDLLSRLSTKVRRGEIALPPLADYEAAIARYVEQYNATPKRGIGCAPAELWAQLQRAPVGLDIEDLYKVREMRTVRRWQVTVGGRKFRAGELAHYERRQVLVEIDPRSYRHVTIRDLKGRFICDAEQVEAKPYQSESMIAERKERQKLAAVKRLENAAKEKIARSRLAITHEDYLDDLDAFEPAGSALPDRSNETAVDFSTAADKPDPVPLSGQDEWDWDDFI